MTHGRELVKSKYSVSSLVDILNRLILEDRRVPDDVFNPLYLLENENEEVLLLNQINWQKDQGVRLIRFKLQQIGREQCCYSSYRNGSLEPLFLYSKFDQEDLFAMFEFLGGPYLDSCYIYETAGKCKLKSQIGHSQEIGTTLEHTAGIISKLVGLYLVCGESGIKKTESSSAAPFLTPLTTKEKPYLFHGVPSQFKNAPPLPF
nr:hypothetical protein [Grapevine virus L]